MVQVLYLLEVFLLAHYYGPPSTETPTTETTILRCHKNSWIYLTSTYLLRVTFETNDNYSIRFEMKKNTIRTVLTHVFSGSGPKSCEPAVWRLKTASVQTPLPLLLTRWPLRSFPVILPAYTTALLHYAEYSCYVAAVVRWFVGQLHYTQDVLIRPSRSLC